MSNVLEAISKLKLKKQQKSLFQSSLILASLQLAIQAYETTFETTCETSCAITSILLTQGLSCQPTPSNFTRRYVFKFH